MSDLSIPRVVFDCNVFLQALSNPKGPAGACLQAVWDRRVYLLIDQPLLDELSDVANRPQIERKLRVAQSRFWRLLDQLKNVAIHVENPPELFTLQRDPSDSHYVNLAISTESFLVVSRDKDLLDLMSDRSMDGINIRTQYPYFRVLTPPEFLRTLRSTESE